MKTKKAKIKPSLSDLANQKSKILSHFDFDKVHFFMTMVNWRWFYSDDIYGMAEFGIPPLDKIKKEAESVMNGAIREVMYNKRRRGYCACGGFDATLIDGKLRLRFAANSQTIKKRTIISECRGDDKFDEGTILEEF